jgi:peptide/nickel transport system ATP-binding protein
MMAAVPDERTEAHPDPDVLVSLRGVSKHFPTKLVWPRQAGIAPHVRLWRAISRMPATVRAVTTVDLEIRRGETLGLVGESGCGKSTLGRTILRLLDPSAGRIVFDTTDLTRMSQRDRAAGDPPARRLGPRAHAAGPRAARQGRAAA